MADSTSHIADDDIVQGSGGQELIANALFDALSPTVTFGRRMSQTSGTNWAYFGGKVRISGSVTQKSNGTVSLTISATNYIECHPDTGNVSKNTSAFTPGYLPLYTVVVGTSSVTSYTDHRAPYPLNDTLVKALADANTTLTQSEDACSILEFTGTLTATRNVVISLVGKKQRTVYNGTNQSLQFIGQTGTGVTVATSKTAIVRSDGTNIVRVTADT